MLHWLVLCSLPLIVMLPVPGNATVCANPELKPRLTISARKRNRVPPDKTRARLYKVATAKRVICMAASKIYRERNPDSFLAHAPFKQAREQQDFLSKSKWQFWVKH